MFGIAFAAVLGIALTAGFAPGLFTSTTRAGLESAVAEVGEWSSRQARITAMVRFQAPLLIGLLATYTASSVGSHLLAKRSGESFFEYLVCRSGGTRPAVLLCAAASLLVAFAYLAVIVAGASLGALTLSAANLMGSDLLPDSLLTISLLCALGVVLGWAIGFLLACAWPGIAEVSVGGNGAVQMIASAPAVILLVVGTIKPNFFNPYTLLWVGSGTIAVACLMTAISVFSVRIEHMI